MLMLIPSRIHRMNFMSWNAPEIYSLPCEVEVIDCTDESAVYRPSLSLFHQNYPPLPGAAVTTYPGDLRRGIMRGNINT
jgi:hypothetical protein